jgi:glutaredoxin 3
MPEPRVIVYTTDDCPFCVQAKTLLRRRGVPFDERVLDDLGRRRLVARTQMLTVPQVFIDGQLIGGFEQLRERDRRDGLRDLIS